MKMLVLGHSNSDGSQLTDSRDGWPWVLQRTLRESGVEAEVVHRLLFAGPAAADLLRDQVEREQPDVVVLATSTHGEVVQLVSNRVRERWGERAAGLARRAEQWVARHPQPYSSPQGTALRQARRLTRRVLGTRPKDSVERLIAYYADCFRALARFEHVQAIVLGGVGYGPAVERLNPGWEAAQNFVYAGIKEEALRRRFQWLVLEELLGGPTHKLRYFHSDGIHTNEESHRIAAEAILPLVVAASAR
jgi:hypothetical protein